MQQQQQQQHQPHIKTIKRRENAKNVLTIKKIKDAAIAWGATAPRIVADAMFVLEKKVRQIDKRNVANNAFVSITEGSFFFLNLKHFSYNFFLLQIAA